MNKATILGLSLMVSLVGCATVKDTFTPETGHVTISRADFIDAVEKLKVIYDQAVPIVTKACREGRLTVGQCAAAQRASDDLKQAWLEYQAIRNNPEVRINWELVVKILVGLGKLVV